MGELPNFSAMTKEEIGDWFLNNDTSALVAAAQPPTEPMAQVDERDAPVMRPATFRLPPSVLEWLEQAAGRDREGTARSGGSGRCRCHTCHTLLEWLCCCGGCRRPVNMRRDSSRWAWPR